MYIYIIIIVIIIIDIITIIIFFITANIIIITYIILYYILGSSYSFLDPSPVSSNLHRATLLRVGAALHRIGRRHGQRPVAVAQAGRHGVHAGDLKLALINKKWELV
jgi:hypothetical protein